MPRRGPFGWGMVKGDGLASLALAFVACKIEGIIEKTSA